MALFRLSLLALLASVCVFAFSFPITAASNNTTLAIICPAMTASGSAQHAADCPAAIVPALATNNGAPTLAPDAGQVALAPQAAGQAEFIPAIIGAPRKVSIAASAAALSVHLQRTPQGAPRKFPN